MLQIQMKGSGSMSRPWVWLAFFEQFAGSLVGVVHKICEERWTLRTSAHIGWFGYLSSEQLVSGFAILISYYMMRNATITLLSVLGFRYIAVPSYQIDPLEY